MAFCSTIMIVLPSFFCRSSRISKTMSIKRGSRPIDGSSTSNTSGCMTSAREISRRRRSPPDNTPAGLSRRSARRLYLSKTISAAALASAGRSFKNPPISKFSSTVICGNTDLSCKIYAMPASASFSEGVNAVTSLPLTIIDPEKILVKPKIECSTVDLPAPFGPIRQSDWPRPMLRLNSCKISILP